jgi:hypothetical protein
MVSHTESLLFDRPSNPATAARQQFLLRGELRLRESVAPHGG